MLSAARDALWPRTGWARAFQYVKHRLNRLPDRPQRIARGIMAGVFISFTPFFGLHFLLAVTLAWILRANILAAILGTFFGNPLTFPLIAVFSTKFGQFLLGAERSRLHPPPEAMTVTTPSGEERSFLVHPPGADNLTAIFSQAAGELVHNIKAIFTPEHAEWGGLRQFFHDVWLPYLVGGLLPGVIAAVVMYYVTLPIITAYQNRRRAKLKEKLEQARAKLSARQKTRADPTEDTCASETDTSAPDPSPFDRSRE